MAAVARTHLEMLRHAVVRRTSVPARSRQRLISAGIELPPNLPRSSVRSELWGITVIRDEADVIEATLRHQVEQGLDAILVADNLSSDGTTEILHELRRDLPIHIVRDRTEGHYQGEKLTQLSEIARRAGARWVLPFDGDEFWFAERTSVGEFLRGTDLHVVTAPVYNLFPMYATCPPSNVVDTGEMWRVDQTPAGRYKVAYRSHRLAILTEGSHNVRRGGRRGPGLVVAHLPWRSREQLGRKLRRGKQAVEATDLQSNTARHWRVLGSSSDEEMDALWRAVTEGRSAPDLYWAPQGPFSQDRVLERRTWSGSC